MSAPPIFVINLDRDTQKMAAMAAQLEGLGLGFERFPAVLGRALSPEQLRRLGDRVCWRERRALALGEVGNVLSHRSVLERIARERIPAAVVLEDDVELAGDLPALLEAARGLVADYDVIKLEGVDHVSSRFEAWRLGRLGERELVLPERPVYGCAGYLVTLKGAELLLPRLRKVREPFDHTLIDYPLIGHRFAEVRPFPVRQADGQSTISLERVAASLRERDWRYKIWKSLDKRRRVAGLRRVAGALNLTVDQRMLIDAQVEAHVAHVARSAPLPSIYVLNLDRSPERLSAMAAQFERLGLAFTRVPAIDGRAMPADDLRAVCPDRHWWLERRSLTEAEIGCALAHKAALDAFIGSGAQVAAIFEDDVTLGPHARSALEAAVLTLLRSDGVVKLEGLARAGDEARHAAGEDEHVVIRPAREPLLGGAGYVISLAAAKRLSRRLVRIDRPFDHALIEYARNGYSLYEARPFPVWQSAATSTIGEGRVNPSSARSQAYRWRKRLFKLHQAALLRAHWGQRTGLRGWLTGAPTS